MAFDPLAWPRGIHPSWRNCGAGVPVWRTSKGPGTSPVYADVLAATKDVYRFEASFREPGVVIPEEEQLISEIPEPRHGQVRRIINSAIAAHRIGRIEPFCAALCGDLLDGLLARSGSRRPGQPSSSCRSRTASSPTCSGRPRKISGYGRRGPTRWCRARGRQPTGTSEGEGLAGAHPEFATYVDQLIADRRAEPRDDFITRLLQTRSTAGAYLIWRRGPTSYSCSSPATKRPGTSSPICCGPSPTTRISIERLRADHELVGPVVEESLRLDPPIRFLLRNCMADVEWHGEQLRAREKVAFGLLSANRDETVFDDPHAFRLDRPETRNHLAFGGGPHVCPGSSLARLEGRVALRTFVERVAGVRPLDPGVYEEVEVPWAHGPKFLRVELTPA